MDLVDALDQTFTHARGLIAGVRPEQRENRTPCEEWDVRALLDHMVGVVAGMGTAAAGEAPAPFALGEDPAAQFDEAAASALRAWRTPGVLDRVVEAGPGPMPGRVLASINLLDTATHTWDLAVATGQPAELPGPVAAAAMEASRTIVTEELRPGRFAPEQAPPEGASPTQRLAAFLGRSPQA
jgi:uncharacterized protein (TIGR03086 family)